MCVCIYTYKYVLSISKSIYIFIYVYNIYINISHLVRRAVAEVKSDSKEEYREVLLQQRLLPLLAVERGPAATHLCIR